jgi:oligoendopeptidase F
LDEIQPRSREADQKVKEKLLASRLSPAGYEIPLRNLRAQAALYRESNLPLLAEDKKLSMEYDRIVGAQTVTWEGQELTITQLYPVYQEIDREKRERAWRLAAERQLADRQALGGVGQDGDCAHDRKAPTCPIGITVGACCCADYTKRCYSFHRAIEQVVVPAATAVYEAPPAPGPEVPASVGPGCRSISHLPLRPYQSMEELESKTSAIFHQVDRPAW